MYPPSMLNLSFIVSVNIPFEIPKQQNEQGSHSK